MTTITWQDGFEGAEVLATVYGAGNVGPGAAIQVGTGRGGGNALTGGVKVSTGVGAWNDPVIVGMARLGPLGTHFDMVLSDTTLGDLAYLGFDNLGRMSVQLPAVAGGPTVAAAESDPRIGAVWRYAEFYFVTGSSGRMIVKVDGVGVIDFHGKTGPDGTLKPSFCTVSSALIDDFYVGLPASESDFFGDYVVTGTAPAATGSVPTPGDVATTQQYIGYANEAPKQDVTVDQQFIIVAIKNKPPSRVRPQVFGVGR